MAANISGPASGLKLSSKETGGVGREKRVEDLRGWKYQEEELQRREKKVLQVRVEERETEEVLGGWGVKDGVSHRSCIVNVKLFMNQILFHCRPGDKAFLMGRWMHGLMDGCDGRKLFIPTLEVSAFILRETLENCTLYSTQ